MATIHTHKLSKIADDYVDAVRIQTELGDRRNEITVQNLWQDFREVLLTEQPNIKKSNVLGKERAAVMAKAAILNLDVRVLQCFEDHGVPFTNEEFQAEFRFLKKTARQNSYRLSRPMRLFMKSSLRISFAENLVAAQSAPKRRKPCNLEVVANNLVEAGVGGGIHGDDLEVLWHQFKVTFLNSDFDPRKELLPIREDIIKKVLECAIDIQDVAVLNKLKLFGYPGSKKRARIVMRRIDRINKPLKPEMRLYSKSILRVASRKRRPASTNW